jgi:hypothetical protein
MDTIVGRSDTPALSRKSAIPCRRFLAAVAGLLCLVVPASGVAHPGALDKVGCHNNRKKGTYECHKGPLKGRTFKTKEEAQKAFEKDRKAPVASNKNAANTKPDPKKNQPGQKPNPAVSR